MKTLKEVKKLEEGCGEEFIYEIDGDEYCCGEEFEYDDGEELKCGYLLCLKCKQKAKEILDNQQFGNDWYSQEIKQICERITQSHGDTK